MAVDESPDGVRTKSGFVITGRWNWPVRDQYHGAFDLYTSSRAAVQRVEELRERLKSEGRLTDRAIADDVAATALTNLQIAAEKRAKLAKRREAIATERTGLRRPKAVTDPIEEMRHAEVR